MRVSSEERLSSARESISATELQKGAPAKSQHKECIRILIADDHPVLREGLRKLIESQPDMSVVGEAAEGREAIAAISLHRPDVLLLDLAMPGLHGFDTLKELAKKPDLVKTIVLTAAIGSAEAVEALRYGARGIVLKESATQQLFKAIRAVMAGEYWLGREAVSHLVDALQTATDRTPTQSPSPFGLTQRELQIVAAIGAGSSNRIIASELHISEQTVKNHLTAIFDKTGASNRLELALFAAKHNLLTRGF